MSQWREVAQAVADRSIDRYLLDDVDDEMLEESAEDPVRTAQLPAPGQLPPPVDATAPPAERPSRERLLAGALDRLMRDSVDVEAAALVSLDGFMIASALPENMQEDRVGAMSAAILALGERAAVELGRGRLRQVFIEGESGYVLLVAAGSRAVLTVLARKEAKLGLVLYDMRNAADTIADTLG